jgi:predicted ATPase
VIHRIFIDNYKCFTNFECYPAAVQLMIGANGSGKTSVFDVLDRLREFITRGMPSEEAFRPDTLTAWDNRAAQAFELELNGNGGTYQYRLVIEQDRSNSRNRIKSEELRFDRQSLYQFDGNEAHLFRDDYAPGPIFPFDWSRSAIATIPARGDNRKLTWFRRRVEKVYVFSPDPVRMGALSEVELSYPDKRLHDLASWLRHLWQQRADFGAALLNALQEVLMGLVNISLDRVSETSRTLRFEFQFGESGKTSSSPRFSLSFNQLSDGQRNLVALYAVLLSAIDQDATVCLDEGDNYVCLREIQPWLTELRDLVEARSGQCLLISHHPEAINYLAAKHGLFFFREDSGPARAKQFDWTGEDVLTPSELMARGWK